MNDVHRIDLLFHSVLARFFTIPARQPATGPVTFAQMRVLWIVDFKGTTDLGGLARTLGVSDSTATELVDRLVGGGYVRRVHASDDRRRVVLTLPPKGRRMLAAFARQRQERFQKLIGVVGKSDVGRMARALETVNEVLGKYRGEA